MCIELLMLSNHLILCYHLFNVSQNQGLFQWVSCLHQEAKVSKLSSASFLPVNIQSWFPLRLTGLISLQFKGFSIVFSGTTIKKSIIYLVLRLLYGPTVTSVHGYWKNLSFDNMDLCWQNDVSAFNMLSTTIELSPPTLLTAPKPLIVWITTNYGKFLKRWEYQTTLPASWEICMQIKKQQNQTWNNRLVPNQERSTSRLTSRSTSRYIVTLLI